ncbi:Hypothetical_protein [Hexamita inflata]|uniref:Hypothetical_protein n=1 Tax=Hexamita inflata TaxID=28002 RepID=A0AA86U6I2_9EUKA|nr:Hypothetical protein HINF_LOCUS28771 [Hexamita inflata]
MSQQPSSPSNQQSSDSNSSKVTEAECNVLDSAFERHHGNFKICILCLMEKKLCKLFRPNRPSQLLHFQNQHGIKREDLCSVLPQLICRFTQPITVSEKRQKGAWMRAMLMFALLHRSLQYKRLGRCYSQSQQDQGVILRNKMDVHEQLYQQNQKVHTKPRLSS